jgi:hypothetical protein
MPRLGSFLRFRGKGTLEAEQKAGMGASGGNRLAPSLTLPRANYAQGRGRIGLATVRIEMNVLLHSASQHTRQHRGANA